MQTGADNDVGPPLQALSSLMDGDLPAGELAAALAGFRQDGAARAGWHAYHLIGDVLRSDELATPPERDECFLQALRSRLAQEPAPQDAVPLVAAAPQPLPALTMPSGRRGFAGWRLAPAAVAAGFVVVAGVLVVNRATVSPPLAAPVMARAPAASGVLVRDARLDRYLAAHRNLGTGVAGAGGAERTVQIVYEAK